MVYLAPLADAIAGKAKWRKVVDTADMIADVAFTADTMYFRTSQQAPRYKVMRVPLSAPDVAKAQTVINAGPGVIVSIAAARDALYVTERRGVNDWCCCALLTRLPRAPAPAEEVALPVTGSTFISHAHPRLPGAALSLAGWTRATKPYFYASATEEGHRPRHCSIRHA